MNVFITGSESTGKTELAKRLAEKYGVPWIPEFARGYIEQLASPYTFEDVEAIARHQIAEIKAHSGAPLVFFDTGLVITRIWFIRRFGCLPDWYEKDYQRFSVGHYLICADDLPWIEDPLRENPDIRRELNLEYEMEISALQQPYQWISGKGHRRFREATKYVNEWLALQHE